MNRTLFQLIVMWLMLGCSVFALLDPAWRIYRNRPGKWGPLHAELALPLVALIPQRAVTPR